MAAAALRPHDVLLPRHPGGTGPGVALSLLAHAGLIAALAYGVSWRSPPPDVVSAELWAAVPQIAAPQAAEPTPAPTPRLVERPPTPAPLTKPAPALPDAQIALEKAKKELARKAEIDKESRAQAEREKAEREKAEREKVERLKRQRDAAEEARIAQQREENLRRMLGQIASSPGGRGNAAANAAPSATYAGRLVRAIKPNIVLTEDVAGNPLAEVEVRAAANGAILGSTLVKSSGSKAWDDAVMRAILRTETLPRDIDGRVPPTLTVGFRPRD